MKCAVAHGRVSAFVVSRNRSLARIVDLRRSANAIDHRILLEVFSPVSPIQRASSDGELALTESKKQLASLKAKGQAAFETRSCAGPRGQRVAVSVGSDTVVRSFSRLNFKLTSAASDTLGAVNRLERVGGSYV